MAEDLSPTTPTAPATAPVMAPEAAPAVVVPAAAPEAAAPAVQPAATRPPPSWDDWRNAKTRAKTESARAQGLEANLAESRGRLSAMEEERARLNEQLAQHQALSDFIRSDPELYRAAMERLEQGNIRLPGLTPMPPGGAPPPPATVAPELEQKLDKALSFFDEIQRERMESREQQQVSDRVSRLKASVTQLVRERGLAKTPEVEDLWVRRAMPGVVRLANVHLEGGGDESDIPWLLERFVGGELDFIKKVTGEQAAAHVANATTVPTVPAGAPAGAPVETPLALGTADFRQRTKDLLRARLSMTG